MNYKDTLEKFGEWVKVIQKSIIVIAGIETIIVLIIGVASSNIYHEKYAGFWIGILIFLGLIYLAITIAKVAYNYKFPSSLVEELKAKRELEVVSQSITRKNSINAYISSSINSLSECECNIDVLSIKDNWEEKSDEDFKEGIRKVTKTFSSTLNILLNTQNHKFTTGVFIDNFRGIMDSDSNPIRNSGVYLLRDDFEVAQKNRIKNLMSTKQKDLGLEIQNLIRISSNDGKFIQKTIQNGKKDVVLMIAKNIPDLKEHGSQKGVLFILTKPIEDLPSDLESVLSVFTSIFSHWLHFYDYEVKQQQMDSMVEIAQRNQDNTIDN